MQAWLMMYVRGQVHTSEDMSILLHLTRKAATILIDEGWIHAHYEVNDSTKYHWHCVGGKSFSGSEMISLELPKCRNCNIAPILLPAPVAGAWRRAIESSHKNYGGIECMTIADDQEDIIKQFIRLKEEVEELHEGAEYLFDGKRHHAMPHDLNIEHLQALMHRQLGILKNEDLSLEQNGNIDK
jgi:hypothetical protein